MNRKVHTSVCQIFAILSLWALTMFATAQQREHRVQKGETAYGISRQYGVPLEDFFIANPNLTSVDLREGMMVKIPKASAKNQPAGSSYRVQSTAQDIRPAVVSNSVKVGIFFPFMESESNQVERLQEYLKGFLLAVEDFKAQGGNAEVSVFNIGVGSDVSRLQTLLEADDVRNLDVAIGGISPEQINLLAQFAQRNRVRYVIPFSSKSEVVESNPYVFQANAPLSALYPSVIQSFAELFPHSHILFLTDSEARTESDRSEFVRRLQEHLDAVGISYSTAEMNGLSASDIAGIAHPDKANVIVPYSCSSGTVAKVSMLLSKLKKTFPHELTLFGYPEWQTYSKTVQQHLRRHDTYFFTSFYADTQQYSVNSVNNRYQNIFGKPMKNVFPKYGLWGYDVGNYFLNAAKQFGTNFEQYLTTFNYNGLQTPLTFRRYDTFGGFVNRGLYIIRYNGDQTEKFTYKDR